MIYLIVEMTLYLLCALALGIGTGWLWRNVQAAAREQALERRLMDAEGRLPALESRLQAAEQQLEDAADEVANRDETIRLRNREIEGLERWIVELQERLGDGESPASARESAASARESAASASQRGATPGANERIAALEAALQAAGAELDKVRAALATEQRRVEGLGRERELQHASLRALEQRLKLAQERQKGQAKTGTAR